MPSIPFSGLGTDTRAIGAALSRQLGVALLMLCWSFSLHAVSRGRRDALQALPAPPRQPKEEKQLKMRLEAPRRSVHGLKSVLNSAGDGVSCLVLAHETFLCFATKLWSHHLPCSSALPTFCIIAPFRLFHLLLTQLILALDVYKHPRGLFLVSLDGTSGNRVKSKSFPPPFP